VGEGDLLSVPLDFGEHRDEGPQTLRHVTVAGIIETETRNGGTPVVKHGDERAAFEKRPGGAIRDIGDAEPFATPRASKQTQSTLPKPRGFIERKIPVQNRLS
jgi:hypothetical protein